MPILQYQCLSCSSLFEHMVSKADQEPVACLFCGSKEVNRSLAVSYYPNKTFCPHDKKIELNEELLSGLGEIIRSDSLRCGGCGVDGAKGKCATGKCTTCTCGGGGHCR